MTLEDYNNRLSELAESTGERLTERVILVSAVSMLSNMQNRIFRDGKDSEGNNIGNYSTTPMYASEMQFVKKNSLKPIGKGGTGKDFKIRHTDLVTGKSKTKIVKRNGMDRKTMYLKEGYKEFRDVQGRSTSEVNLQLRGDLKLSFTLQAKEKEVLIGFNSEEQSIKRKGLEAHFKKSIGTIFPATQEEKEEYSKEILKELRIVEHEIIHGI